MTSSNSPSTSTEILDGALDTSVDRAIELLRADRLIGLPTETVYGLAGLASSKLAVRKVFVVKKRPLDHPLILHIASYEDLDNWAQDIPEYARVICKRIWPGPLTIVLRRTNKVCDEITGGRETVAIRVPNHEVALRLLRKLDDGVVAPSANRFGKVSPTTAQHVVDDLGSDVSAVLDGGVCLIGIESTILDCTLSTPQLLRPGAISTEQIRDICGVAVEESSGESRASGMLEKHYAPNCRVELAETHVDAEVRLEILKADNRTAQILDFSGDLALFAANLYSSLRQADTQGIQVVVVVVPPAIGLGVAIRDRLAKASQATSL
ncbi:MAG: threonylcarbamoyl-AMP synthase [Acidimicrobiaceae bacterium]|nr:threonylcarbamoyl-AMP synthase [Acidimicrobiaceae bacterium]